jgi:hypothetical protein
MQSATAGCDFLVNPVCCSLCAELFSSGLGEEGEDPWGTCREDQIDRDTGEGVALQGTPVHIRTNMHSSML